MDFVGLVKKINSNTLKTLLAAVVDEGKHQMPVAVLVLWLNLKEIIGLS